MGGSGNGSGGQTYGLPRFREASFKTRFPFSTVSLKDAAVPVHPGAAAYIDGDLKNFFDRYNDLLYFEAVDTQHHTILTSTDGMAAGTQSVFTRADWTGGRS